MKLLYYFIYANVVQYNAQIMKEVFYPILDLQNNLIKDGATITLETNIYQLILNKDKSEDDIKKALFKLVMNNYKDIFSEYYSIKKPYYKRIDNCHYDLRFCKHEDLSYKSRNIMFNDVVSSTYDLRNVVFVNLEKGDVAIFFSNPEISQIMNNLESLRVKYFRSIKKTNPYILAAIILAVGLIVAAYFIALSNRYEVDNWQRFDKWTGTYEQFHSIE